MYQTACIRTSTSSSDVEEEGNEQQDLLNLEKPYEVDEFFKLIAKHSGNNTWQCLGKCGKSSSGFVSRTTKTKTTKLHWGL